MNRSLKWKLIAGFVLVFIAGGITGAFVIGSQSGRLMNEADRNAIAQRMRRHLRFQLHLTDEQMTKISPIIDKTASQLADIRGDTGKRVRDVIVESHKEIAQYLTPEQQQRLKQMEERRRQWMQQHHGWRRNGPGPGGLASPPPAEASP